MSGDRWLKFMATVAAAVVAVALTGPLSVFLSARSSPRATAPSSSCPGKVAVIEMPRSKYPRIVDHIEDSWAKGYPRVLRVNRKGAEQRRDKLLDWYEDRHPQPKGDDLDLDEEPAAVLRRSWRASVRPIPQRENRGAGGKLGAELRGVPNGACVKYDFKEMR
jgi:hypothetical protein